MRYKRIDAFDMNFEECSADKKFKLISTSGMGEKRIYVGHDEELLDEFFDLDNVESFIILKNDLIKYLIEAKDEYYNPVQSYKNDISQYYTQNVNDTNAISEDIIELHFTKKYDSQKRYYLNFENDGFSSKKWNYFRNIALPRVTKMSWLKIQNVNNGKLHIYMKPTFYISEEEIKEKEVIKELTTNPNGVLKYRKRQTEYRNKLLDSMHACVITNVTEDRILVACHIKPFNKCDSDEERYDVANGLIMTPTYHSLFDLGFISFQDNGTLMVSPFLSNMNRVKLNLKDGKQYVIPKVCAKYLTYHRENVFNQIPDIRI